MECPHCKYMQTSKQQHRASSSQGHYGFHSFPVVDWFCLFIYLWVLTFPLLDCSEFGNFVITLIFLKWNINISNPKVKDNAYKALVRPTMEYACTTWDPYQQNNRHSLEMVERRAARYARNRYHNTSSVTEMLHQLQWTSLEARRRQARLSVAIQDQQQPS